MYKINVHYYSPHTSVGVQKGIVQTFQAAWLCGQLVCLAVSGGSQSGVNFIKVFHCFVEQESLP